MALRNAVLAALLEGEASGYDLAKGFDASVANFWMATPQQLYRELERMEQEGLIAARVVQQARRPNKRLFSLTEAGLGALHDFTSEPAKSGAIRNELMVKVQAVDVGDVPAVQAALAQQLERSKTKLAGYERLRTRLLNGRTEGDHLTHSERVGPYLTLLRGISFEHENIHWAQLALTVLAQRATTGAQT
ncbi:PadR family transcriptional regulator [Streptomyces sp. NPDC060027]|uniref:PadR family transcriptional regulator n=1 Tax=Streptomyces sp. NPDC060027 TaxID=3347040 RepID=UPI0036A94EE1